MKNKDFIDKVRFNIAMFEFGKEYHKTKENSKKTNWKIVMKVAIIIIIVGALITSGVQAIQIVREFYNREPVYITQSISEAIHNGYIENLNMEYYNSDGIGLKINSFLMSENNIQFTLDFKLNEKIQLEGKKLEYGYILYNENKEVYHVENGTNNNLQNSFIKENNLKLINNNIEPHYLSSQSMNITYTSGNIIKSESITAKDYFSKAKKIYIQVTGIGYKTENGKYKALSNSNWKIELNVPKEIYLVQNIKYNLKNLAKEIKMEEILVTDTSTTLTAEIEEINGKNQISIIDEKGKEYEAREVYYEGNNIDKVTAIFSFNKSNVTDKMYLKIKIPNKEEMKLELIKIE